MKSIRVGVIGGGASGIMAAINAAHEGAIVTLLEAGDRVGKKILSTGNGKCNLSNLSLSIRDYNGCDNQDFLAKAFSRFDSYDTIQFFRSLGMMLKDKNGYLYPASEQASTVLDVLRFELKNQGIAVHTNVMISDIQYHQNQGYQVTDQQKYAYHFDRLIIAVGGLAAPKTGSDGSLFPIVKRLGHHLIPMVPALVQLRCAGDFWKSIAGVRCEAVISGEIKGTTVYEKGELQLTDYGISGIPVFQLSRKVNYLLAEQEKVLLHIDFMPDLSEEELLQFGKIKSIMHSENGTLEEYFTGILNKKLMMMLMKKCHLQSTALLVDTPWEDLQSVYKLMKHFDVTVVSHNGFDNAQVTAGGVNTKELTENMESVYCPGLYFAGEIIDVDGRCGGYNLQWAWTSGAIAGRAAAGRLK